MKLAVVNDWYDSKSAVFWNKDGFLKALDVLRKRDKWEVKFFKKHERAFVWEHDYVTLSFSPNPKEQLLDWKPDAILFFADLSRPIIGELQDCGIPMAIAFSGGAFDTYEHVPDLIFVESASYYDRFKANGRNVRRAFGTNTEIFFPFKQPKIFDAVMTATFAAWKRQELFADAMGSKGLICGWWQAHEPHTWQIPQQKGVPLLHHQMPESINLLMNMSHTVLLTANSVGGSQRSVLEAMAAGIPPVVMSDSEKTSEYVREAGFGKIVDPDPIKIREAIAELKANPQDPQKGIEYIKNKYTQNHYADQLRDGILSIL